MKEPDAQLCLVVMISYDRAWFPALLAKCSRDAQLQESVTPIFDLLWADKYGFK